MTNRNQTTAYTSYNEDHFEANYEEFRRFYAALEIIDDTNERIRFKISEGTLSLKYNPLRNYIRTLINADAIITDINAYLKHLVEFYIYFKDLGNNNYYHREYIRLRVTRPNVDRFRLITERHENALENLTDHINNLQITSNNNIDSTNSDSTSSNEELNSLHLPD